MLRKLVKQGAATLMVSLPSKWIRSNNLNKGDEINMQEAEQFLIISAAQIKTKNQVEIKLQDLNEASIRTLITNTYRKGYDKIIVKFENSDQYKILESTITTKLIGFDIVKKEKNTCIVENITEPSIEQFDNILGKMFSNISILFQITAQRFNSEKPEEDFNEVEQRIMQYDNFCRRVISKKHITNKKTEFFWTFLHLVDHGHRELYHLNNVLGKIKISEATKLLLQDCEKMFDLIKETYLTKNVSILSKVHELNKQAFYRKGYSLLERSKSKENIIVYHLMACLRKFFQTNSPLTGLIL